MVSIEVRGAVRSVNLAVSSEQVRARDLLWAIMLASGTQAELVSGPDGLKVTLAEPDDLPVGYRDHDSLLPIRTLGYYTPAGSVNGRMMLSTVAGGSDDPDVNWIGWQFPDLPLFYQEELLKAWPKGSRNPDLGDVPELKREKTYALWTKGIRVGIGTNGEDFLGSAFEVRLPAF